MANFAAKRQGETKGTVLVVGSAHLDILAQATNRDDVIDRVGEVYIEVGGTACNIAIDLAHAGVKSRLMSAMNHSAYSKVIVEYLSEMGVEPHIEYQGTLPTGGFSAHIDTTGEMVSAVSSMPVELVVFSSEVVDAALDGVKAVMLDCNLSEVAINQLVAVANERDIPVYLSAVSEEKSLRIGLVEGAIKGVFINLKEFTFFCRQALGGLKSPGEAASVLNSMLLLTQGANGSILAMPNGEIWQIPAAEIVSGGSRLGMGDALAAGLVRLHEIEGLPPVEAACDAMSQVSSVGSSRHCHPGKIGALESAIDHFKHGAGHDAMTGLLNRGSTEKLLTEALERQQRGVSKHLSILILDIDHFKSINDTYGHNVGDDVIVALATEAQSCLRGTDYLGRWGGEEFIVVLPDTSRDAAIQVAERVRLAVQERMHTPRQITVSIGCCEADEEQDFRALVERADKALYEAKHGGRNRVVCAAKLGCTSVVSLID